MPLIPCPECRREVSDLAEVCPQCGYPVRQRQRQPAAASEAEIPGILARDGKIAAIKRYRELNPRMALKEAKDYVDSLEDRAGATPRTKRTGCVGVLVLVLAAALGVLFFV